MSLTDEHKQNDENSKVSEVSHTDVLKHVEGLNSTQRKEFFEAAFRSTFEHLNQAREGSKKEPEQFPGVMQLYLDEPLPPMEGGDSTLPQVIISKREKVSHIYASGGMGEGENRFIIRMPGKTSEERTMFIAISKMDDTGNPDYENITYVLVNEAEFEAAHKRVRQIRKERGNDQSNSWKNTQMSSGGEQSYLFEKGKHVPQYTVEERESDLRYAIALGLVSQEKARSRWVDMYGMSLEEHQDIQKHQTEDESAKQETAHLQYIEQQFGEEYRRLLAELATDIDAVMRDVESQFVTLEQLVRKSSSEKRWDDLISNIPDPFRNVGYRVLQALKKARGDNLR